MPALCTLSGVLSIPRTMYYLIFLTWSILWIKCVTFSIYKIIFVQCINLNFPQVKSRYFEAKRGQLLYHFFLIFNFFIIREDIMLKFFFEFSFLNPKCNKTSYWIYNYWGKTGNNKIALFSPFLAWIMNLSVLIISNSKL